MILTTLQLEDVRRFCAERVPVTYVESAINTAAQIAQDWIDANRGALPGSFSEVSLTTGQRSAISAALGAGFTNQQKTQIFNAVARFNEIVVAAPVAAVDDPVVHAAIRGALRDLVSLAIDTVRPGMTDAEKMQALRKAVGR
jgi:hypothetical protein